MGERKTKEMGGGVPPPEEEKAASTSPPRSPLSPSLRHPLLPLIGTRYRSAFFSNFLVVFSASFGGGGGTAAVWDGFGGGLIGRFRRKHTRGIAASGGGLGGRVEKGCVF